MASKCGSRRASFGLVVLKLTEDDSYDLVSSTATHTRTTYITRKPCNSLGFCGQLLFVPWLMLCWHLNFPLSLWRKQTKSWPLNFMQLMWIKKWRWKIKTYVAIWRQLISCLLSLSSPPSLSLTPSPPSLLVPLFPLSSPPYHLLHSL